MTSDEFLAELEANDNIYEGIKVLAYKDAIYNFWASHFGTSKEMIVLKPINGSDKIGDNPCGMPIRLSFNKNKQ